MLVVTSIGAVSSTPMKLYLRHTLKHIVSEFISGLKIFEHLAYVGVRIAHKPVFACKLPVIYRLRYL